MMTRTLVALLLFASTLAYGEPGKIDLNSASVRRLAQLPELSSSDAKRIVAYREKYGPFRQLEDLLRVPGILLSTVRQAKTHLMVSTGRPDRR